MNTRIVGLAMVLLVAGLSQAQAKMVPMGAISRADVKSTCDRVGGRAYGIDDLSADYGCNGTFADVGCSPDHTCRAYVGDTQPMTGNSLDYVLTGGKTPPAATTIQPLDLRVSPIKPIR
jgi:hypothetical protein